MLTQEMLAGAAVVCLFYLLNITGILWDSTTLSSSSSSSYFMIPYRARSFTTTSIGAAGTTPTVVISYAKYDNPHDYISGSPFLWSLRCSGFQGRVVLVVDDKTHTTPTPHHRAIFSSLNITTHPSSPPPLSPVACQMNGGGGGGDHHDSDEEVVLDPRCLEAAFSRYYYYKEVLLDPRYSFHNNTRVLLADFRDTIFQVSKE